MPRSPERDGSSRPSSPPRRQPGFVAVVVAVGLGGAHAIVTALWLGGSTLLLDTVGGEIEQWGRERSSAAVLTLMVVLVAKVLVGGSALLFANVPVPGIPHACYRTARASYARALGWLSAVVLIAYGGVLTLAGLLVQAGALETAANADRRALTWHAYFWDPWFLCWGMALAVVLWRSRGRHLRQPTN